MTRDPILTFENVARAYPIADGRVRHALRDVSFQVSAGSVIAIAGRSGSGKSTLLNLAAGIDVPSAGRITLAGRDLGVLGDRERTLLRRDHVGLVFQFFHLLPHLSVLDNVALPAWIAGVAQEDYRPRALQLLERVELTDRADDAVQKLSGGEMQRVAICRALLRRPRLLLADEPTGSLDDATSRLIMQMLLKLVEEEQSTLVYVSHSRELAAMAGHVWTLQSGILDATHPPP